MSLAVLADHLASKGRNGDTMLVHMTPEEVRGLHALALAHGGQLTINPETGLYEASFLKKLLPAIAGMALNFIAPGVGTAISGALGLTGAAAGAIGTGIAVGGITGLATGSLKQGIMAGLGAYGGASLAGGFMGASGAEGAAGALGAKGAATGAGSQAAMLAEQTAGFGAEGLQKLAESAAYAKGATPSLAPSFMAGVKGLGTEAGRKAFMEGVGGASGLMRAGTAAAIGADAMVPTATQMPGSTPYQGTIRPYKFDPYSRTWTAQPTYSATPVRTEAEPKQEMPQPPEGYRGGGIVALANGGAALTPEIARNLMQRSMTTGVPTSEFDKYGGYGAVSSLYNQAGGTYNLAEISPADLQRYARQVADTGVGNRLAVQMAGLPAGQQVAAPTVPSPASAAPASTSPASNIMTPEQFKQYIYQGGADDVLATQRGVEYSRSAGLTPQQTLDVWNQALGTNFGMADYERVMKQFPAQQKPVVQPPVTPAPTTPPSVVPGTQGTSVDFGGDIVIPEYTPPTSTPTLGPAFQPTPQTMEQVRTAYEQGGGATRMPTITDIKPTDRTYTQNQAFALLEGYLKSNPNAQYSEVVRFASSQGIPEMQARAAYNEFRFSGMTGGTKSAYDYLMGRGPAPTKPFVPGGGPIMRPYAEAMGLTPSAISRFRPAMPPRSEGGGEGAGTTGGTTGSTTGGVTGGGTMSGGIATLPSSLSPTGRTAINPETGAEYTPVSGTPITDALFGTQDISTVPVVDRSTYSDAAERERGGQMLDEMLRREDLENVLSMEEIERDLERARSELGLAEELERARRGYDYDIGAGYYGGSGPFYTQEEMAAMAGLRKGGLAAVAAAAAAQGGDVRRYNLGGYSDGGRLLRGPGDGVSDSIPATIGDKQPARLADGEFVIPARIVSEIGNGSTEAGARKLYKMMERVQRARAKTVGKGRSKVAKDTGAEKYLPA